MNSTAFPSKEALLALIEQFIAQRPGMDPRNYGDWASYRRESAEVTRHARDARALWRYVELRDSITAQDIVSALASGGRLTLAQRADGTWALDYTTGQYFATEYRRAASRVAANVLWDYWRSNLPEGTTNAGDALRRTARREVGRSLANTFFA